MELGEFQRWIARTYLEKDAGRGELATLAWLIEEVGELAKAMRQGDRDEVALEMSDVLAWLATLANQMGIDLAEACLRYRDGCPKCGQVVCMCQESQRRGITNGERITATGRPQTTQETQRSAEDG